jgi:hypothetical protein
MTISLFKFLILSKEGEVGQYNFKPRLDRPDYAGGMKYIQ